MNVAELRALLADLRGDTDIVLRAWSEDGRLWLGQIDSAVLERGVLFLAIELDTTARKDPVATIPGSGNAGLTHPQR